MVKKIKLSEVKAPVELSDADVLFVDAFLDSEEQRSKKSAGKKFDVLKLMDEIRR